MNCDFSHLQSPVSCRCSSDSDEEPVTKQPRLSRRQSRESRSSSERSTRSSFPRRIGIPSGDASDSDALSDNKLTDDGSYFEVIIIEPNRVSGVLIRTRIPHSSLYIAMIFACLKQLEKWPSNIQRANYTVGDDIETCRCGELLTAKPVMTIYVAGNVEISAEINAALGYNYRGCRDRSLWNPPRNTFDASRNALENNCRIGCQSPRNSMPCPNLSASVSVMRTSRFCIWFQDQAQDRRIGTGR